jgi:peptide/nickel transport system substrate-binding protein
MGSQLEHEKNEGRHRLMISRRAFLQLSAASLEALALGGLLSRCGPEAGETPATTTAPATAIPATVAPTAVPTAVPTPAGPKQGGVLVAAAETNPTGLDPHKVLSLASQSVVEQVYDTLFELDPDLNVVPRLCKSYDTPDDTTYILHLEENVYFSDGTKLTSEDVIFSLERIINPDTASGRAVWFQQVETIEALDENTVQIKTSVPFAPLINAMANAFNCIVSKKFTEANDNNLDQVTMGSGPFVLAEYIPDQLIRLERHENYWRQGKPYLDATEWKIIPDDQGRVAALRAKEVDVAWFIDAKVAELFENDPEYVVYEVPVLTHASTWINCSQPPLDNPKVREAMSYALNRQEFLDTVAFGKGVLTGPIPAPETEWALPVSDYPQYTQDIEKAKSMLADAGYPDGFTVKLKVSPQYVLDTGNAQVLQNQLKEVGINVEIESVEWGNLLQAWFESDYEMLNLLMLGQPDPDGYTWGRFHSESPGNYAKVSNPELDVLLDQQRTTIDREERKQVLADVQRKIVELTPMLYYYCYYVWGIFRPYVKGVTPMANSSGVYLMNEWLDK